MAGKKKGKKGKSQEEKEQPSSSQQQGTSGVQSQTQQARGDQNQPVQQAVQRQQQGPQGQQQQRGPQGQQQQPKGPQGQQQQPKGPQGQQHQPRGPQGQQQPPRVPQGQQQPQKHRGPQGQPQPQGAQGQQQQRGPQGQPWGPRGQQQPQAQQQFSPREPPQGQVPPGFQPQQTISSSTGGQEQVGGGRGRGQARGGRGGQAQQQRGPTQVAPTQPPQQTSPTPDTSRASSVEGQHEQVGGGRGRGQARGGRGGQAQQQRGPTQVSPPQQTSPTPGTSRTSSVEGSVSTQMSRMDIGERKIEGGQGDSQLVPIESKIPIKPGTKGRKILIETNHFSLNLGKLTTAIHYDVNIVPDVPKNLLRPVFEVFRKRHFKERYPAFDGRKNLYSAGPLPFNDYIEDEIVVLDSTGREKTFKVEIKFANRVDLTPLKDLMKSRETPREAMQVVDIVLRSAPAMSCIPVGRSFFTKPHSTIIDLGEGMEMYNGFYQAAIRGWKPLVNIDVANKAFPKNTNLIEILPEILSRPYYPFERESLNQPLSSQNSDTLNTFVRQLKIVYEIPGHPATKRVYRVNGLDSPASSLKFTLDNGQSTTIENYFEKNKNYRLRYPHLPTIWVGAQQRQNKIRLPMELCTIEPGQVINRKLTETQTSKMIKVTAGNTATRKRNISNALHGANYNQNATVREFGFSVGNEFEKLEARVLKPPSLGYSQNRVVNPMKGIWRGEKFFSGVTINKWTIACVDRRPPRPDELTNFANQIFRCAADCGMVITQQAERPFDQINGSRVDDIKRFFQAKKERKYDVIFIVVPNSGPQYSYVKTAAEINVGCLTQCIKMRTLGKMNVQTTINILLKVNSKLNGTNHFLATRPPIMNRPCMIMGADVTHPSPDARDIPSVAAVTASHDPKAFQYNICWRLQPPKLEIIEDLEAIAKEQLLYFYQKTKVKPERIVFFRDGVSEGQFEQVIHAEIRAIRAACKKLQADGYEPSITFLVVQKRHHTRLFPTNPNDSEDRNMNVPAGTCVDSIITHPFMQDFYLVSHASIQGVAKPTKYCTLWDDNKISNDDIEELTYYLCHMFTRCNRSVSYPAPTYYAHLAAARAKVYIENERLNMSQLRKEFDRFQIQENIRKGLPMFFV